MLLSPPKSWSVPIASAALLLSLPRDVITQVEDYKLVLTTAYRVIKILFTRVLVIDLRISAI
jgi:hypothetical protein